MNLRKTSAIVLIIGILLFSGCISGTDTNTAKDMNKAMPASDSRSSGTGSSGSSENVQIEPTATVSGKNILTTSTPIGQKSLKLAKKFGPYDFPQEDSLTIDIELDNGLKATAFANNLHETGISFINWDEFSRKKNPVTILLKVYNKDGSNFKCSVDNETNECYFSKDSVSINGEYGIHVTDGVTVKPEELKSLAKWEILIYTN